MFFADQPSATVFAACLGAFVALMTIIITKEQKVSEFRQAWINSLRDDLADAISAGSALSIVMQVDEPRAIEAKLKEWARLVAALARVELRLNLSEDQHRELQRCIREAETLVRRLEADPADYDPAVWIALQEKVVAVSQPLLKLEWRRVKKGETIYRLAKTALVIVIGAGTAFFGMELLSGQS